MSREFDATTIRDLGWRQGSIMDRELAAQARLHAPKHVSDREHALFVVISHDCDVLSPNILKEPIIEVIGAIAQDDNGSNQKLFLSGRNPRRLHINSVTVRGLSIPLNLFVHDRWPIPRVLLMEGPPAGALSPPECQLLAEWIAKRYIRPSFPNAFDTIWHSRAKSWRKLMTRFSSSIKGIYLRLNTFEELPDDTPYRCDLILVMASDRARSLRLDKLKRDIEQAFQQYWNQFQPYIECEDVVLYSADQVTLRDIAPYQRIDADWVSFEDDTPIIPLRLDLRT